MWDEKTTVDSLPIFKYREKRCEEWEEVAREMDRKQVGWYAPVSKGRKNFKESQVM